MDRIRLQIETSSRLTRYSKTMQLVEQHSLKFTPQLIAAKTQQYARYSRREKNIETLKMSLLLLTCLELSWSLDWHPLSQYTIFLQIFSLAVDLKTIT